MNSNSLFCMNYKSCLLVLSFQNLSSATWSLSPTTRSWNIIRCHTARCKYHFHYLNRQQESTTVQIPVEMVWIDPYICTKFNTNACSGCPGKCLDLKLYSPEQVLTWKDNTRGGLKCLENNTVTNTSDYSKFPPSAIHYKKGKNPKKIFNYKLTP